jgi:hypothetical protein
MAVATDLNFLIASLTKNVPPIWRDGVEQTLKTELLRGVVEPYDRDVEISRRDPELSPEGQARAHVRAANAALAKVTAFAAGKPVAIRNQCDELEKKSLAKATPPKLDDPADRLERTLAKQEYRNELKPLTQEERYNVAMTTDDALVLDTILSAGPTLTRARPGALPRMMPFLDPKRRAEVVAARAKAVDPKGAEEIANLRNLIEVYEAAIAWVREALYSAVPSARPAVIKDPSTGKSIAVPGQ